MQEKLPHQQCWAFTLTYIHSLQQPVCYSWHRNSFSVAERLCMMIVVKVFHPDCPAGVCLAVEHLTCRSRAHFPDLPPVSQQALSLSDKCYGNQGRHCNRAPVENWLCTNNGCNYVTTGAEKKKRELPEKKKKIITVWVRVHLVMLEVRLMRLSQPGCFLINRKLLRQTELSCFWSQQFQPKLCYHEQMLFNHWDYLWC